jgi:hypothetical protein
MGGASIGGETVIQWHKIWYDGKELKTKRVEDTDVARYTAVVADDHLEIREDGKKVIDRFKIDSGIGRLWYQGQLVYSNPDVVAKYTVNRTVRS